MRTPTMTLLSLSVLSLSLMATAAQAQIVLKDPTGDDKGPGTYTYPTDPGSKSGSFDVVEVKLEDAGASVRVTVTFAAKVEDPWESKKWQGNGFSLQMVFLFIDTDHKAGSGHKDALPGLNVRFLEPDRWEKALIISPQPNRRLEGEIKAKAAAFQKDVVLPTRVRVQGRSIVAEFPKAAVGGAPSKAWGYQALIQSNEGYPGRTDLMTRKVNEFKGKHRFGGGHDFDCDPHVIDMLAGAGKGGADEKDAQYRILKGYTCDDEKPEGGKRAEIPMVRLQ